MTIRMYAEHKGLPLDDVSVSLEHKKIHAEDCEDCESREGRIDHITKNIKLEGDLTEEQKKRIGEIADKCPVYRTLNSEIKFRQKVE